MTVSRILGTYQSLPVIFMYLHGGSDDDLAGLAQAVVGEDLGKLLQRRNGTDHGTDIHPPGGDQCQGAALGVGIDKGSFLDDFLFKDMEGLNSALLVRTGQAEHHDGGLFARDIDGLGDGGGLAHTLDHSLDAGNAVFRLLRAWEHPAPAGRASCKILLLFHFFMVSQRSVFRKWEIGVSCRQHY